MLVWPLQVFISLCLHPLVDQFFDTNIFVIKNMSSYIVILYVNGNIWICNEGVKFECEVPKVVRIK